MATRGLKSSYANDLSWGEGMLVEGEPGQTML